MGQCMTPFVVKTKDLIKPEVPVPCGKCPECIARRTSGWSFRLMQEDKVADSSLFITLTYDTKKVPISRNGFMDLSKRDCQLFFKSLRKAHGKGSRIKYYLAGEYGGKSWRPHYHIILFNAKIELVQSSWPHGHVHYGTVSGASVGYTLKYIAKGRRVPVHRNDDRQPEFSLMSKGLGLNYVTEAMVKWHKDDLDNRVYCVGEGGKKISMPRYYKDKVFSDVERKRVAFLGSHAAEKLLLKDKRTPHEKVQSDLAAFRRVKARSVVGESL